MVTKVKIKKAEKLVLQFCDVHKNWLSKIKEISLDSAAGDDLPSYKFFNIELNYKLSKKELIGIGINVEDSEREKEIILEWLEELLYEIKEKVDSGFLSYKRDKSDYKISADNFAEELNQFIMKNIW